VEGLTPMAEGMRGEGGDGRGEDPLAACTIGIAGRKRQGLRVSLASHADGLGFDSPRHVGHCDVRV
jgi:hypothetical protein